MDYLQLTEDITGCWTSDMYSSYIGDHARCERYLERSDAFLKKYPDSKFEDEVRNQRAGILVARKDKEYYNHDANIFISAKSLDAVRETVQELERLLASPARDKRTESLLFRQLGWGYQKLGDEKTAEAYFAKFNEATYPVSFKH